MGALEGRVAVITGAGGGLGRAHALLFAAEGASVVVNDRGTKPDGTGGDSAAADAVVAEIHAAGGTAVANADDVADWDGGRRVIEAAVETFGRLDVLVNNAGFLRDRALATMDEDDWDAVVNVHLKGHFVPTRWAAAHWRERHKAGEEVRASIVHTSSTSGLLGNPGQTNYGAAKAGIAGFSGIAAQELAKYGVRSNCIAPAARTRLTETVPGLSEVVRAPADGFDVWDPANVSPIVAYLATESCPLTGVTLYVQGGTVRLMDPWHIGDGLDRDSRWSIDELSTALAAYASR
jgi:NAD(P)-dependent dehydrogenase (short-subunit alcohol dehydrogenase family)